VIYAYYKHGLESFLVCICWSDSLIISSRMGADGI